MELEQILAKVEAMSVEMAKLRTQNEALSKALSEAKKSSSRDTNLACKDEGNVLVIRVDKGKVLSTKGEAITVARSGFQDKKRGISGYIPLSEDATRAYLGFVHILSVPKKAQKSAVEEIVGF